MNVGFSFIRGTYFNVMTLLSREFCVRVFSIFNRELALIVESFTLF